MNSSERQNRIVEYLRIKPISHGQVYTFQIAIPESQIIEIPLERREALKSSLTEQGSNLIPLIVRRTEAYSEEEEYEVVYGVDWCIVAKELDTEKLWVWVFDMTDEQAAAAKAEMEQLVRSSDSIPVVTSSSKETELVKTLVQQVNQSFHQIEAVNKKIDQISVYINKIEKYESQQINIYENVKTLTDKVEQVTESVKRVEDILDKPIEIKFGKSKKPKTEASVYNSMTRKQLKDIAKERQISITTRMTKPDIINVLEKADARKS